MCYNVNEEDVARARNQLKTSLLFSQDVTTGAQRSSALAAASTSSCAPVPALGTAAAAFVFSPSPSPFLNAAGTAEDIGRSLLVYGRRIPKSELFARIDAVDADTIKGVANRFFLDQARVRSRGRDLS